MTEPLKVLIVEDEIITAKCLVNDLKELGFEVPRFVIFGEKAAEVAMKEKPDLILMDIRLAGSLDGIEAAEKIKREIDTAIIYMTGYATKAIKERAMKTRPLALLDKPVFADQIVEIIEKHNLIEKREK